MPTPTEPGVAVPGSISDDVAEHATTFPPENAYLEEWWARRVVSIKLAY